MPSFPTQLNKEKLLGFFNKGDLLGEWISSCIWNFVVIISFPLCWWMVLLSFQNTVVHLSYALQVSGGGNWESQVLVWILWHLNKLQLHWEVKHVHTPLGARMGENISLRGWAVFLQLCCSYTMLFRKQRLSFPTWKFQCLCQSLVVGSLKWCQK